MKLKILTFITILILAFSAQANDDDLAPSCSKPYKPDQFNTQAELDKYNTDGKFEWSKIYIIPAILTGVCAVLFLLLFRNPL